MRVWFFFFMLLMVIESICIRRKGTYVYLWLNHVDIWQKQTQHCKAIILQLKINKLKKKVLVKKMTLNWNGELVTGVYQGGGWVHTGKEKCFNHRYCLKLLDQGDNKQADKRMLSYTACFKSFSYKVPPYHLHTDGFYQHLHPLVDHWLAFLKKLTVHSFKKWALL